MVACTSEQERLSLGRLRGLLAPGRSLEKRPKVGIGKSEPAERNRAKSGDFSGNPRPNPRPAPSREVGIAEIDPAEQNW